MRRDFDQLADEIMLRIYEVKCRDRTQLDGIRKIIERLQHELALLESFDRSGVTIRGVGVQRD